jgi:hypothetical protein
VPLLPRLVARLVLPAGRAVSSAKGFGHRRVRASSRTGSAR